MKKNYEIISVIPDNTETYFITLDKFWPNRIFRRMATILVHNKNYEDGCIEKVFIDERGNIHEEMLDGRDHYGYDTFTVGMPVYLPQVNFICNSVEPDGILPLLKTLKSQYGITFAKPEENPFKIFVCISKYNSSFWLSNTESNVIGFDGYSGAFWEQKYKINDSESLFRIGKLLGLFRYIFDMPEFKYTLDFRYAANLHGPDSWAEMIDEGIKDIPYEEQCRIDLENEAKYKTEWEKQINEAAEEYYNSIK